MSSLGWLQFRRQQICSLSPTRDKSGHVHGTSDILDMAFITPGLSSRDISFRVADDHMGSDHFPIQILPDKPLKRNTPLTEPHYRFDKTNDDFLHNTLKDSLTNIDTNITTQDDHSSKHSSLFIIHRKEHHSHSNGANNQLLLFQRTLVPLMNFARLKKDSYSTVVKIMTYKVTLLL